MNRFRDQRTISADRSPYFWGSPYFIVPTKLGCTNVLMPRYFYLCPSPGLEKPYTFLTIR